MRLWLSRSGTRFGSRHTVWSSDEGLSEHELGDRLGTGGSSVMMASDQAKRSGCPKAHKAGPPCDVVPGCRMPVRVVIALLTSTSTSNVYTLYNLLPPC